MQNLDRVTYAHLCALNEPLFILNPESSAVIGTRAMLEGESMIPDSIQWPAGTVPVRWEDSRFAYELRRLNLNGDYWSVQWSPIESAMRAQATSPLLYLS